MRRLSLLFFVLCLSPSVHAGLFISVNGVIHPPLDEVLLQPGETAVLGIHGDGTLVNIAVYLLIEGPGSIDGHTMVYPGSLAAYGDWPCTSCIIEEIVPVPPEKQLDLIRDASGRPNIMDLSWITLADAAIPPAPLDGLLVDDIILHCDAVGNVRLTLISDDLMTLYNTQDIQQIPEPVTLLLLGLGGLLVRGKRPVQAHSNL